MYSIYSLYLTCLRYRVMEYKISGELGFYIILSLALVQTCEDVVRVRAKAFPSMKKNNPPYKLMVR